MSTAVRVTRGSARLLARAWFRLWAAGERDGDRIGPLLLVVIAGGALWFALSRAPIIGAPLTLAWITAAWRAGAPEPQDEAEEPAASPLPDVAELVAALHEIGAPHAHVAALADHLRLSPARVREALAEAGIPVSGGCRMKGRGVSTGVKAEDFPPLPSPTATPSDAVVVAGQDSNNNTVRRWDWGLTLFRGTEKPEEVSTR